MPRVTVNDVEIYYEEHGKGRPMVFLSETACDGEVWKIYQVEEFSKDHRVILHDYRGTGQSSKPSIDYTTQMFCDDLVALMDYLNADDAVVVGHEQGAIGAAGLQIRPIRIELIQAQRVARHPVHGDGRGTGANLAGGHAVEARPGSWRMIPGNRRFVYTSVLTIPSRPAAPQGSNAHFVQDIPLAMSCSFRKREPPV